MDASRAGEGSLEIFVKSSGGLGPSVATHVEPLGNAAFGVAFVPEIPTDHLIHVTFNDLDVPGMLINNSQLY